MSRKKAWLPPRWFVRLAWRTHRGLYKITGGRKGLGAPKPGKWGTLRLTATGRKSGEPRSVMLGYFVDGTDYVTMAMNGWSDGQPQWWLNLLADPEATVETSDGEVFVRARAAEGAERERLWSMWQEIDNDLDQYAERRSVTDVVIFERTDG